MALQRARSVLFCSLLLLVFTKISFSADKPAWAPVPADELALKDDPEAAGAPAIILYREYVADDVNRFVAEYVRMKVLTEAGKKYGDIEIPYFDDVFSIDGIEARTTRPDGTSVIFHGDIHDKVLVRGRGLKLLAKTFSLPEVQVGSVVEYRYRMVRKANFLMSHHWQVQADLYTRRAHFELRPATPPGAALVSTYRFMPEGKRVKANGAAYVLDMENIPGLETEELMPPPGEVRAGVDLVYRRAQFQGMQDLFWADAAKQLAEAVQQFIGKNDTAKTEVARLIAPSDQPEAKLRKLYARAQQIHNIDDDLAKSTKEVKRQNYKENKKVDDVFSRAYGNGVDVTLAFVAMAKAAGFESGMALVSSRARQFFHKEILSTSQFNTYLAWVQVDDRTVFLDPALRDCPYGLLSWDETGVEGIRAVAQGNVFMRTPALLPADATIRRSGELQVRDDGSLEGGVKVTWTGEEALEQRAALRDEDDAGRRKYLEAEIQSGFPTGAQIEFKTADIPANAELPLSATFHIVVPSFASATGRRLLLPSVPDGSSDTRPFQRVARKQDVVLRHPFQRDDDFTYVLPSGFAPESVPSPAEHEDSLAKYSITFATDRPGTLHVTRTFEIREWHIPAAAYGRLRAVYQKTQATDSQQAVFARRAESSSR